MGRHLTEIEEQNKAVVLKWFEELGKWNLDAAFDLCVPDYKLHYPSNTKAPLSREQNKNLVRAMSKAFPDIVHEIKDLWVVGNIVIVRAVDIATHTGEFQGIPATNNRVEISWIPVFHVEDGKIVEIWEEADMLGFMEQMGMELKPK